jgi:lysozyme
MKITSTLKRHEGSVVDGFGMHIPYEDSLGHQTIGYGHLLSKGIPEHIAEELLRLDIEDAQEDCERIFEDWDLFTEGRREALTNMVFNLGAKKFLGFKKMIAAINDDNWELAADEALDSRWAKQVKSRSEEIAEMLRQG